jgi:hypothetical protein
MERPIPRLPELRRLCQIARKISSLEIHSDWATTRTHLAEKLYQEIVLISFSFLKLLPDTDDDDAKAFDFFSLATLARNVIECHNVFHYLCIDHISKTESDFRQLLMSLHHHTNSERILKTFGLASDTDRRSDLVRATVELHLKKNAFFNSLEESVQKQMLKGRKAYYWGSRCHPRLRMDPHWRYRWTHPEVAYC